MKFAKIDFIDDINEIPLKFNLHKKEKILNWYIRKFNPYIKEDMKVFGVQGYNIKLPIKKEEAFNNEELFLNLYEKTINSLKHLNVEIVDKPYEFYSVDLDIQNTDKKFFMALFIFEIIKKAIKIFNKDLKDLQIVIIDEKLGVNFTKLIINMIFENINYLTVVTENDYSDLVEKIYFDNGLNIAQIKSENNILNNGDVIINLKKSDFKNYHNLKSGGIFIDLSGNLKSALSICIKREDVFFIDNINVSKDDEICILEKFEMAYYIKSNFYKTLKDREWTVSQGGIIKKDLDEIGIKVNSFVRLNKTLGSTYYSRLRNKIK